MPDLHWLEEEDILVQNFQTEFSCVDLAEEPEPEPERNNFMVLIMWKQDS